MHSLLQQEMLQLTIKISLYMAATYFCPFGPSSGSIRRNFAKVTVFAEIISKNTSLKLCCAVATCAVCTACCVTRRTAPSTHTAVQTEAHIATAQQQF
jgi:hypothetical protein